MQHNKINSSAWRECLFEEFKGLVPFHAHKIAKGIGYQRIDFEDLCSSGYEALWEAILKYNPEQKETFKLYVNLRIRGGMLDYLRKNSPCCAAAYALYRKLKKLISEESAQGSHSDSGNISSFLFDYLSDESAISKTSEQSPEENLNRKQRKQLLLNLIHDLPDNQRMIIIEHYINDKSFVEISIENKGLSKSWITRLHKTALAKLRNSLLETQPEYRLNAS